MSSSLCRNSTNEKLRTECKVQQRLEISRKLYSAKSVFQTRAMAIMNVSERMPNEHEKKCIIDV